MTYLFPYLFTYFLTCFLTYLLLFSIFTSFYFYFLPTHYIGKTTGFNFCTVVGVCVGKRPLREKGVEDTSKRRGQEREVETAKDDTEDVTEE